MPCQALRNGRVTASAAPSTGETTVAAPSRTSRTTGASRRPMVSNVIDASTRTAIRVREPEGRGIATSAASRRWRTWIGESAASLARTQEEGAHLGRPRVRRRRGRSQRRRWPARHVRQFREVALKGLVALGAARGLAFALGLRLGALGPFGALALFALLG